MRWRDKSGFFITAITVIATWNYLDRAAVGILQEPIRHELGLSDFQLGLLGGPAFALLYVTMGVPFGRLAERANRIKLISFAFMLWSCMTALCGAAGAYLWLILARAGVSIGEAALGPSAHSLIADRFAPERRSAAVSIYMSGVSLGSLIAAFAGGAIAQSLGWRVTFYVLGATGLVFSILFGLLVPEAPRATHVQDTPSFGQALKSFVGRKLYWHLAIAIAVIATMSMTTTQYLTSFYIRTYHLEIRNAAIHVALIAGVAGAMGTYLGGFAGNYLARRSPSTAMTSLGWLMVVSGALFVAGFLAPTPGSATVLLMLGNGVQSSYFGPTFSALHGAVAPRARGTAVAMVYLVTNLIGYSLVSPMVGAVSDALAQALSRGSGVTASLCGASTWLQAACDVPKAGGLQWALCLLSLPNLWAAYHFFAIGKYKAAHPAADSGGWGQVGNLSTNESRR